jgi:dethiobiotin synthase
MKKVFIAATKQNDGKTTVSLGLVRNFQDIFKKVGFIKPIGQRYLQEDGLRIDEDSILIEKVCGIKCGLKDMSPIAVEKGFTEKYIAKPEKRNISKKIKDSFNRVSKRKELVIVEGTGHAGVGSVFDHSNATVARLLGCKVILISSGGIGRPIDEICLNKALFEREGVKLLGVIINKVLPSKFEKINRLVRLGLENKGIKVLGVLPYDPVLSRPTFGQIIEETDFKVLCGKDFLENPISKVIVGAMELADTLRYITKGSLLIVPGDRRDIIAAALNSFSDEDNNKLKISGIILTEGIKPEEGLMELMQRTQVPVLIAQEDTYDVATLVHDLTVKIRPADKDKIDRAINMVKESVDLNRILKGM